MGTSRKKRERRNKISKESDKIFGETCNRPDRANTPITWEAYAKEKAKEEKLGWFIGWYKVKFKGSNKTEAEIRSYAKEAYNEVCINRKV